jgi:hypothetical protein
MTDLYLCSVSEGVCRKHNSVMVRKISEGIKARDGGKSSDVPLGARIVHFVVRLRS